MSSAQKQHKPGVWTDDEDALLAQWQGRVGNKWSEVARHIPGKTGQQCAQRWRHRVNPNISREKWSEEEDAHLGTLVAKYGNSWAEIARRLPGRTDQQCMGRWRRHLDPSIKRDGWEEEEDEQLRELYGEYGSSWSCISKSMHGRTAQQCRARWCQLTNAERPSRSSASRSKSNSTLSKQLEQMGDVGANPRRQSTANTHGGMAAAAGAYLADPAELFAAAAAEGAALAAAAAGGGGARRGAAARHVGASRRLSTVSEVAATFEDSWSQEEEEEYGATDDEDEDEEAEEEDDSSPDFTLRRTTARTSGRTASRTAAGAGGAAAGAGAAAAMAAAGLPLPPSRQHDFLQPPAQAQAQQVPTPHPPTCAPAAPAVVLPAALLPLKLELPGAAPEGRLPLEDEDSPALTHAAAASLAAAAAADLLSPMRSQLPPAPPLFTPSSSGRKRPAGSRMAAFGPALPPLVIPDTAVATAAKGTPVRATPGSGPMSLEMPVRSPNVLTLLQSPPHLMEDLFRSPGWGSMLTPPWARSGSSNGGGGTQAAGGAQGQQPQAAGDGGGMEESDRQNSVARRLNSAPSFSSLVAADAAVCAAAALAAAAGEAQRRQQQAGGGGGLQASASFDFGVLLGSPPKKSRTAGSPGASTLTAATVAATTPWVPGGAEGMLLCSNSAGGDTSLAMAVQQHLLLASTAKAGSAAAAEVAAALAAAAPVDKENGEQQQQAAASRQATLTAAKPPLAAAAAAGVPASPPKQLTSSNVRMKLHALLENV